MQSQYKPKNELFSGLTFSLTDIDLNNSGLNLVPISLEENENISKNYDKEDTHKEVIENVGIYSSDCEIINLKESNILPPISNENIDLKNLPDLNSGVPTLRFVLNPETKVFGNAVHELDNMQFYEPVKYHWFYQDKTNLWRPFSLIDNDRLETRYTLGIGRKDFFDDCVSVEGGRFDVYIKERLRKAVYWEESSSAVRRVSWLYREEEGRNHEPYDEMECELLEVKYAEVLKYNLWHQWLHLSDLNNENIVENHFVFHTTQTMAQYRRYFNEDILRARVVYRGMSSISHLFEQGDYDHIDHVVMVVHGIGSICDLRGRGLVDCVSDMRRTSNTMAKEHFHGHKGRVEYLPVCWHSSLHSHIDKHLSTVTLPSVPRLRVFTNTTLVDVLCYSSPGYCESILSSVATEMNRLRHLFMSRCPGYDGSFSIVGHSLGAMISLDLVSINDLRTLPTSLRTPIYDITSIPPLNFDIGHLFALGSPISLFLTARGLTFLGKDFKIETCKSIINIFHPFDPVAYRMEPMLSHNYPPRPELISHHKGRKRLHLELKDNIVKVGSDIKSKLLQTLKVTWNSLQEFASAHKNSSDIDWADEDVLRVISNIDGNGGDSYGDIGFKIPESQGDVGFLNGGKRVDYVLQEAPLESFNDYLFALGSHACYWESEDTLLKILNEIYLGLNISPGKLPPSTIQTLSFNEGNMNLSQSFPLTVKSPLTTHQCSEVPPSFLIPSLPHPTPSIPNSLQTSSLLENLPSSFPVSSMKVSPQFLKETTSFSNILPPSFPIIQNASFFIPSTDEGETSILYNNDRMMNSLESIPEITKDLPPLVSYTDVTAPIKSQNSLNNIPSVFRSYYQSYQPEPTVSYFQPLVTKHNESIDVDSYFSEFTKCMQIDILNEPISSVTSYLQIPNQETISNESNNHGHNSEADQGRERNINTEPFNVVYTGINDAPNLSDHISVQNVDNTITNTQVNDRLPYMSQMMSDLQGSKFSNEVQCGDSISLQGSSTDNVKDEPQTSIKEYPSHNQSYMYSDVNEGNYKTYEDTELCTTESSDVSNVFSTDMTFLDLQHDLQSSETCEENKPSFTQSAESQQSKCDTLALSGFGSSKVNTMYMTFANEESKKLDLEECHKNYPSSNKGCPNEMFCAFPDTGLGSEIYSQDVFNFHQTLEYNMSLQPLDCSQELKMFNYDKPFESETCQSYETKEEEKINKRFQYFGISDKGDVTLSGQSDRSFKQKDVFKNLFEGQHIQHSKPMYSNAGVKSCISDERSHEPIQRESSSNILENVSKSVSRNFSDSNVRRTPSPMISGSNPSSSTVNVMSKSSVCGSRPLVPQSGKLFTRKKK